MGILNNLFATSLKKAEHAKTTLEAIEKHWNAYRNTVSRKTELIQGKLDLQELKQLLEIELVDIEAEEKEEAELIDDLEAIEHDKKIRSIQKLEQTLYYAETRHEYVYALLHKLHEIIKNQIHIVTALINSDNEQLRQQLEKQLEQELLILEKIEELGTFHEIFTTLVNGEYIVKRLSDKERKILKRLNKKPIDGEKGITQKLGEALFKAIEGKVHEAVATGELDYHPDVDYQYVNSPAFVELVKETLKQLKKRAVTEETINAFVQLFRNWFNERD